MATLQVIEERELSRCEKTIEKGMATFVEVGQALAKIRDGKLYRDTHKTFAAYCKERWGHNRDWAYKLIDASAATECIPKNTKQPTQAQAKKLAKAPAEQQAEVWEGVLEDAEQSGEEVTAARVEEAVAKISGGDSFDVEEIEAYQPPEKPKGNGRPLVPTKDREAAVKAVGAVTRWGDKLGVHADIDDAVEHITKVFQNA